MAQTFKNELKKIAASINLAKTESKEKEMVYKFFKVLTEVDGSYLIRPVLPNVKTEQGELIAASVERINMTNKLVGFQFGGIIGGKVRVIDETYIKHNELKKIIKYITENL